MKSPSSADEAPNWRQSRPEILFLTGFVLILAGGFTLLSLHAVNDRLVEPFTAGVARAGGWVLKGMGQGIEMHGTVIRSPTFAVSIRNGCNGVETMLIYSAAVLAFPVSFGARATGLVLGLLAIQAVNLVRVVALFLTGAYFPSLFDASHTTIWQTVVVLFGICLWIFWAHCFAAQAQAQSQ